VTRNHETILDELLVLRCRRGDERALGELIERWQDRLFYFLRRSLASEQDTWDVLQQTWLKVHKSIRSLQHPDRLPVWLYAIARRTALSHWRSHYRRDALAEEHENLSEVAAAEVTLAFDDAEQVHQGLSRISPAHREILTLHFLEDFTLDDLSEILGIPAGTAKSRLFYAKRALRAVLEGDFSP
jgi:RNA polymerase sigma factor (sigma-70 family)